MIGSPRRFPSRCETPPDHDLPCDMCGKDPLDCVCPECPRCGATGDPNCYKEPDLGICGELYKKETIEQKIARAEFEVKCAEEALCDAHEVLEWLREQKLIADYNKQKERTNETGSTESE